MAVPKRKTSRSRTRHRKSQWLRAPQPTLAKCARCKQPLKPHTVCAKCGHYAGRQVITAQD